MFTGALVDTRTRAQKQRDRQEDLPRQSEMFSQRDLAQFGVTAHPRMSLAPSTRLVLIREDPRSDEEKERDLQREAEQHTQPLFADHPPAPSLDIEGAGALPLAARLPGLEPAKLEAYLEVVAVAERHTRRLTSPTGSTLSTVIAVAEAREVASQVGLTPEEISAALTVGEWRGERFPNQGS
jgi:multidrug efflux pump subunit AcrB